MDTEKKTDEEILGELENIYQRVAKEDVGKISFADLNEPSETEPEEQPGKKPSALVFYGTIFLAVCLVGIVLTIFIIRHTGTPDIKPTVKTPTYETPTYRISITIPSAPPKTEVKTPPETEPEKVVATVQDKKEEIPPASPKTDVKAPPETEPEKVVAAVQDKKEEISPAPVKKEETEKRKEIKPAIEKLYTIQISAIRNFEIAKGFLKKIEVSQPDVHLDRFDSKKYGVWYRVFTGHFASKTEALKYMKEKNIRKTYPGSYILKIPASPPNK